MRIGELLLRGEGGIERVRTRACVGRGADRGRGIECFVRREQIDVNLLLGLHYRLPRSRERVIGPRCRNKLERHVTITGRRGDGCAAAPASASATGDGLSVFGLCEREFGAVERGLCRPHVGLE